jgi:hypothetical protein
MSAENKLTRISDLFEGYLTATDITGPDVTPFVTCGL